MHKVTKLTARLVEVICHRHGLQFVARADRDAFCLGCCEPVR